MALELIRIDWEDHIRLSNGKRAWVQAMFHWDWDTYGRERTVVVDQYKAYAYEDSQEIDLQEEDVYFLEATIHDDLCC